RLYMGHYDSAEVYEGSPVEIAEKFQEAGAKRLHVVDLDAARSGSSENRRLLRKMRRAFTGIIEVGGGIRTQEDVEHLLETGVDRLVVGTILAKEPETVEAWVKRYGQKFIGGIDSLHGHVKIAGWKKDSKLQDSELARQCKNLGLISIIFTNIAKDGTLEGPDLENTLRIHRDSGLPVILSGGISSPEDLALIAQASPEGLPGVITGKAIYKGRIDIAQCIADYQKDPSEVLW
ncbi:MAG: 1-(5-phosphoribosyl)-5-((5-phosphoribosylamino)methylideneamino)imidazole-4-carboxamide isomerase, partial [Spirochaetes bacterium GWB1_48_6]